jgi:hypothetical protein
MNDPQVTSSIIRWCSTSSRCCAKETIDQGVSSPVREIGALLCYEVLRDAAA